MSKDKTDPRYLGKLFLLLASLSIAGCTEKAPAVKPPAPTPSVVVTKVVALDVPNERFENGTTLAQEKVEIRARVRGFIATRDFKEGDDVKKDQLLFVIEEGPFKAAVDIAKAAVADAEVSLDLAVKGVKVATVKSQLERDEAALALAKVEVARYIELVKGSAAPQQQLDMRIAREKELAANVSAAKSTVSQTELTQKSDIDAGAARVAAAKAELMLRELDLSYPAFQSAPW
jgi:multidrug efflux pump subunit AcrA (membrane-fusion protein)